MKIMKNAFLNLYKYNYYNIKKAIHFTMNGFFNINKLVTPIFQPAYNLVPQV